MGGYASDEYEDLDEYEEDGEEQEYGEEEYGDEYEEEAVHEPTEEELEYLRLRQRLKESLRKEMGKELGTANGGSREHMNSFRKDNYGSFFGPSQPVIAQRVIQESKSLLENPDLAAKFSKTRNTNNKPSTSSNAAGSKPRANPQKPVNGLKKKVEVLKNTRDYSFLLSDDAEIPSSTKSHGNLSTPRSDALSAQAQLKSRQAVVDRQRELNIRDGRKQVVSNGQPRPKVGSEKMAPGSKLSMDSRKQFGSNSASGPGRPVSQKGCVPSRNSMPATGKNVLQADSRSYPIAAGSHKSMSSVQQGMRKPALSQLHSGVGVQRPQQSGMQRPQQSGSQRPQQSGSQRPQLSGSQRPQSSGSQRPQQSGSQRPQQSGSQRPLQSGSQRPLQSVSQRPPQSGMQRPQLSGVQRPSPSGMQRTSQPGAQRPASSHMQSSLSRKTSVQRNEYQDSNRPRPVPKSSLSSSKDEVRRQQSNMAGRGALADQRQKAKPKRPFAGSDDEANVSSLIRNMFGYNPRKYQDLSDDDSDMVADWETIKREERRSARIAKEEDDEEQRKEEEEKRRLAKRRKIAMAR